MNRGSGVLIEIQAIAPEQLGAFIAVGRSGCRPHWLRGHRSAGLRWRTEEYSLHHWGRYAIQSQHIGDLDNYETLAFYEETLRNLQSGISIEASSDRLRSASGLSDLTLCVTPTA